MIAGRGNSVVGELVGHEVGQLVGHAVGVVEAPIPHIRRCAADCRASIFQRSLHHIEVGT